MEVEPPEPPRPPDLPAELDDLELGDRALHGLRLERVALRKSDFAERAAPDLRFAESLLDGVLLDGAEAAGLTLVDVRVERGSWSNLRAARGSLARLEAHDLRGTGVDLTEAELRDLLFTECRLDLASFRFATLARVVFRDCRLEEADFHGATLSSVRFERCRLNRANLHAASFSRSELRGCDLEGIEGAASLRGVRMPWTDVVGIADRLAEAVGIAIVE